MATFNLESTHWSRIFSTFPVDSKCKCLQKQTWIKNRWKKIKIFFKNKIVKKNTIFIIVLNYLRRERRRIGRLAVGKKRGSSPLSFPWPTSVSCLLQLMLHTFRTFVLQISYFSGVFLFWRFFCNLLLFPGTTSCLFDWSALGRSNLILRFGNGGFLKTH